MNLAELQAAIGSYTENVFDTVDLNTFIVQAEERINNSVQLPSARKTATVSAAPNVATVALPVDYLAPYSLALVTPVTGNLEYLLNKNPDFVQETFPIGSFVGPPSHYAQVSPYEFILGPVPNVAYSLQLVYFGYPASITIGGTSWLGENFSPALLYGSLVEAYIFMKGEADILAAYEAKFKEAVALLKQLVDAKTRQDSYRAGQVRYPVV
jgi:hypothetical protein